MKDSYQQLLVLVRLMEYIHFISAWDDAIPLLCLQPTSSCRGHKVLENRSRIPNNPKKMEKWSEINRMYLGKDKR